MVLGGGTKKMRAFYSIDFSDLKISQETLDFEMDQFGIYTDLANRHPGNKRYKKALQNLTRLIEDHQKLLNAESVRNKALL
jgi:hypothetical protein